MAKIEFKFDNENLDEGIVKDMAIGAAKAIGKTAAIALLAPLTGTSGGGKQLYDKLASKITNKNLYQLEREVEKETENSINGVISLVASVKVLGKSGFDKVNLEGNEVEAISHYIREYFEKKENEFRKEANRAITHDSKPPLDYFNDSQLQSEFKREITKKINTEYRTNKTGFEKSKKWIDSGMRLFGSNLPKQIAIGINNLVPRWAIVEKKKVKGK